MALNIVPPTGEPFSLSLQHTTTISQVMAIIAERRKIDPAHYNLALPPEDPKVREGGRKGGREGEREERGREGGREQVKEGLCLGCLHAVSMPGTCVAMTMLACAGGLPDMSNYMQ